MLKTECAYCGAELEWDQGLFASGNTGEPYCEECSREEV
jgi:NAD-dependent SIR2 family protein deacetylase